MPAIVDPDGPGETVLKFESGTILQYLGECYSIAEVVCWGWVVPYGARARHSKTFPASWIGSNGRKPANYLMRICPWSLSAQGINWGQDQRRLRGLSGSL